MTLVGYTSNSGQQPFNLLIAVPAPRDIPIIRLMLDKITEYDRIWVRNYPEYEAYQIFRNYFLKHQEYTHLAISSDDLQVDKQSVITLVDDIKRLDPPIISGICNLDTGEHKDQINICIDYKPPVKSPTYIFPLWTNLQKQYLPHTPIIQVMYSGFPFMILRRDVVQQIGFTSNAAANGQPDPNSGCCIDVVFCWDCNVKKIPILVDLRCKMHHMKYSDLENAKCRETIKYKTRSIELHHKKSDTF